MSSQPDGIGLNAVSLERRLTLLFGFYVIALFSVVAILGGSVVAALFLMVVGEILFSFWRPTPVLGPASYKAPAGPAWQTPITLMRWYELLRAAGGLAVGGIFVTVLLGIIIFSMRPTGLGSANYTVIGLMAAWLISRWFWAPPLVRWVGRSMSGAGSKIGNPSSIQVGTDGLDIVAAVPAGGGPPRMFHVAYGEIDELRMLDWLTANAYGQSMLQYDPSLTARSSWELIRFIQGQLPRPSIFMYTAAGTHLLIRGSSFLYLIAGADQTGPSAVAAWQAWRAAHSQPTAPHA